MKKAFPVNGNIEPTSFPHLLVDLHKHGATGSLKVNGPQHPKALYYRGGKILFGSSNDPRDQLGSILIESGKITREQLEEINAKVGPGNPLAKVLADSGFVNQRELGDAARVKVERILADVLSWTSGSFEFEDGVLPKGAVDLKLSSERLLFAAVQRIPDRMFALRHVELHAVLEPATDADAALSEIRAEVWPLLERLDGQRTLKDAIALTRIDEFEAAKTACALLFLGIVRRKQAVSGELDLAQDAQDGFGEAEAAGAIGFGMPAPAPAVPMPDVAIAAAPEPDAFTFPEAAPPPPPEEPSFAGLGGDPAPFLTPAAPSNFDVEIEAEPDFQTPAASGAVVATVEPEFEEPARPSGSQPRIPDFTDTASPSASQRIPKFTDTASPSASQRIPKFTDTASPSASQRIPIAAPAAPQAAPSFATSTPSRPSFDTVPGDRQAYVPPIEPPAPVPDLEVGVSKPTRADLAALDELLNPKGAGRPRPEKWEPQFRPPTTPPRRTPMRAPRSAPSRIPLIAAGLAGVVLATVAAWFFFLRGPTRGAAPSQPVPAPTSVAVRPPPATPAATVPAALPSASAVPASAPPGTTPATEPAAATARPTPNPAAAATPAQAQTRTAEDKPVGDGRTLLSRGTLPEAARAFATALAGSRTGYSLQLLTACAPETVQKAASAARADELFILPVQLNGKACYRVCWGSYPSRAAAEAALSGVPAYFRQGGARPRVSPLAEILP